MQHSSTPLISVVLPVYNHGHLLAEAIDSVLAQSYTSLELIVVNDGSTDNSAEVLEQFSAEPRLRVHHQHNRGIAAALNQGFSMARGSFFSWTSADNRYHVRALEQLLECVLRQPKIDLVYANVQLIDENGAVLRNSSYRSLEQDPEDTSILRLPRAAESLLGFSDNFINACFLYRRSLAQRTGTYRSDLLGIEDYDFWLRAGLSGKFSHVGTNEPLYQYRLHTQSLTAQLKCEQLQQRQQRLLERSEAFCRDEANLVPRQPRRSRGMRRDSEKLSYEETNSLPLRLRHIEAASADTCPFPATLYESWNGLLEVTADSPLAQEPWLCFAPLPPPPALFRARDTDFAAVQKASHTRATLLLPLSSTLDSPSEQAYRTLIASEDLTLVFFCSHASSRATADALYLASGASDRLRIIDVSAQSSSRVDPCGQLASLLYAVSSVDGVFVPVGETLCPLHLSAVVSATAGKPLFTALLCARPAEEVQFLEEYLASAVAIRCLADVSDLGAELVLKTVEAFSHTNYDAWLASQSAERFARCCRGMAQAHFPLKV